MGILCPGEKTDVDLDNIPYKEIVDRELINGEKLII